MVKDRDAMEFVKTQCGAEENKSFMLAIACQEGVTRIVRHRGKQTCRDSQFAVRQ